MCKESSYHIFSKSMAGIIYLIFFLVQFNVHLNGTPNNVSYFSCDYSSINNKSFSSNLNQHSIRTDSKHSKSKLNKRFHPERLFTVTSAPDMAAELNYRTQTALIHEEDPLTNYSFNSPSLRGPPAFV
ncbi:MAG TPA: hypothetical protein VFI33_20210 [Puia sp.]|nr:hypothetical protein [Puia sp.]